MKLARMLFPVLAVTVALTVTIAAPGPVNCAQATPQSKLYQQMSQDEKETFVAVQARRIAREISGRDYEFTTAFEAEIQKFVEAYAKRIGNGGANSGKSDLRPLLERGQAEAPKLIAAFRARNVSPLIGLYLPWIESAYVNIQSSKPMGAIGMFQFVPKTGEHYGLSAEELLDVGKSADAAARYITDSIDAFNGDPMKEALALLSYNRGAQKVTSDLASIAPIDAQGKQCSICALTAASARLDKTFQNESVYYVPNFFAAAILGENPQAFGLQTRPLSSYQAIP